MTFRVLGVSSRVVLAVVALLVTLSSATRPHAVFGEIITYSLVNVPSLQNGLTLSGTLVLDTSSLSEPSPGEWLVGSGQEAAFTSWSFAVSGTPSYSVSHTDTNALLDITHGGSASLIATRTTLEVAHDALLQIGINSGSAFTTSVLWQNRFQPGPNSQYFSTNSGTQQWQVTDSTTLDNAFASGAGNGWILATAVPEPSGYVMAVAGIAACCGAMLRKRFSSFA